MLHSVALNGCWKELCLKAYDFQCISNYEHNVINIHVLTHNVPGFPNLEEADLDPHDAELNEVYFFLFLCGTSHCYEDTQCVMITPINHS